MKIKKILIANRGEIAIRVINTCRAMNIETVSIYTKGEEKLPHVLLSDESYCLGEGALKDTYLNIDKIINIAKDSRSMAIHPGYGFLSENSKFCNAVKKEGLIFIGPSASAIELMGDKVESKKKVEELKGNLIPGYHGDNQDKAFLHERAEEIGYPVLIKASAGGGGKGMRIVERSEDFSLALDAAKREALNAFGNDKVLIEKFIKNPRHIEIQVISDQHGGHYHLFERECSIQRRYQKIIEESPSPFVDDYLRERMTTAATSIAKGINYLGAGTVEFIVDEDKNFYFLEMNTRLQVEHPVTEAVTGKDLVALQIKVAAGEKLNFDEDKPSINGHAIEARIYAEDPWNEFLPSIGEIEYIGSIQDPNVRLDTGYWPGNEVTINFDPMCAKITCWGENREQAINKSIKALNHYLFQGLQTNRQYLQQVLQNKNFLEGNITTNFVEDNKDSFKRPVSDDETFAAAIASTLLSKNKGMTKKPVTSESKKVSAWDSLSGYRNI